MNLRFVGRSLTLATLFVLPFIALDAADENAKSTTVSIAKSTESVAWAELDNVKAWELSLTVNAGDPFKAGSATVASAGIEQWMTTENSESKAAFLGSVPANSPQKKYEPKFNGVFKTTGGSGGKVPTWAVKGAFGIKCTYELGSTVPNGNPEGTSGLADPTPGTENPADLTFTVTIIKRDKPKVIPNRMSDLASQLPVEAGRCTMDPGAQTYDSSGTSDPVVETTTCPRCKQQTLRHVHYFADIAATAPAITISLPTWSNRGDAGSWAQGEWDNFYSKLSGHEDGHNERYLAHCAAAKALIEAFAKTKFVGEVCSVAKGAGETKASALALAEFDKALKVLDEALDALATKIAKDQKTYDDDTKHGVTEGCKINGDIPLLGDEP